MEILDNQRKKRMKNFTFSIPDETLKELRGMAEKYDLKMSELARAVLLAGIAQIKKDEMKD